MSSATIFQRMADMPPTASTAEISPSKTVQEIINEAKRIEESTLCSSKGHFAAAETWLRRHFWIGVPNAVLAALAGATALSFSDKLSVRVAGGVLSIAVAGLAALQLFLNPNDKAAAHLSAGSSYDALNGKIRIFWSVECWEAHAERVLTERLKDFAEQKDKLSRTSPQIPSWAYRRAQKGIEAGEGSYQVDKKIWDGSPAAIASSSSDSC